MSSKYYSKPTRVRAHTRRDPRINKRVSVDSYTRNQRYRNYKGIPREQALRSFNQRSNRAKAIDLSRTSKNVLEEPNEYWLENVGRSDVKGIDTKIKEFSKQELEKSLEDNIKKGREIQRKFLNAKVGSKEKEEYQKQLNKLTKENVKIREELRDKKKKKGLSETLVEKTLERSKTRSRYKELKEKLKNSDDWEYNTEGVHGIWSKDHIALYSTKDDFNKSPLYLATEGAEEFELEDQYVIISGAFGMYRFGKGNKGNSYFKEYIDEALKVLDNPRIYYKPDHPLLIKDDKHAFVVAPRVDEDEDLRGDIDDPNAIMSYKEYNKLSKNNSKKEFVEKIKKMDPEFKYSGKGYKKYKDYLLGEYVKTKYGVKTTHGTREMSLKDAQERLRKFGKEYNEHKKAVIKSLSPDKKKSKYEKQLEELSEKSKRFHELSDNEKKRLERESGLNYMKSTEAFEEYNPNKKAIYRGKETKAYIDWKKQFSESKKNEEELASDIINLNWTIQYNERELKDPHPSYYRSDIYKYDYDPIKRQKGINKQKQELAQLLNQYKEQFGEKELNKLKGDIVKKQKGKV